MQRIRPPHFTRFFSVRRYAPVVAILVGCFVAMIFWPATRDEILDWDDHFHLTDNPFIQPDSPNRFAHFWIHPFGNLYIPVAYNAWALIYQASMNDRAEPRAPILHGANVVVHALNSMLMFALMWRLMNFVGTGVPPVNRRAESKRSYFSVLRTDDGRNTCPTGMVLKQSLSAAAIAALFFALHPLQVESVTWISEFRGLTSAFFGLLAMIAYIHSTRRAISWWNLIGLLCFALALLCKPSAASIPLMLLTIDLLILRRGWRRSILSIIPWIFLSIFSLAIMRNLQSAGDAIEPTPFWARPFIAGDAIVFYLSKLVWPLKLSADYSRTPQVVMNSGAGFWVAWIIPIGLIALMAWRRWWMGLACLLVMIFALSPVLGIVSFDFQRISTVADRYMYLALTGPALGIAVLLARHPKTVSFVTCALVIALMLMLLPAQIRTWHDNKSIWNHAFEINHRSVVARANLAAQLVEAGRISEGERQFRSLLEIAPNRVNAYLGLADLAMRSNDLIKAEQLFRKAFEIDPINTAASSRLGFVLIEQNRKEEAESQLKRAIELNPKNTDAMVNLGALLLTQRRFDESTRLLEDAIRQHPRHPQAWANLLRVRRATQPERLSESLIEDVKRLTDNDPWPLRVLARECLLQREWHDAETLARAALERFPRHAETINDLAQSLAFQDKLDEAITEFDRAYKLRPDLTMIGDNLEKARALKTRGAFSTTQSTTPVPR